MRPMFKACRGNNPALRFAAGIAVSAGLSLTALPALAASPGQSSACGSLATHYGPYDYRTDRDKLKVVEQRHFTAPIEMLVRDRVKSISGELSYTLHAFPNHHRALLALVRYGQRERSLQPVKLPYPIDCYFDRAMRFRPDDTVVRVIFARHLSLTNRRSAAVEQLDQTVPLAKDNALSHYNLGLAYFEIDQFDKALTQAHRALALGYESPALKDVLSAKGHWADPPAAPEPASAPASAPEAAASQAG